MKKLILVLILCLLASARFSAYADVLSDFAEKIKAADSYFATFYLAGEAYGDSLECRGIIWYAKPDSVRIELSGTYNGEIEHTLIVREGNLAIITDNGETLVMSADEAIDAGYKEIAGSPLYSFLEEMGGSTSIYLYRNILTLQVKEEGQDLFFLAEIKSLCESEEGKGE